MRKSLCNSMADRPPIPVALIGAAAEGYKRPFRRAPIV